MTEKDFVRHISGMNKVLSRNVSNWLNKRKVYPHNVLVFEEEHRLFKSNIIELSTECSNRNHSAVFPLELPSWFIRLFTKKGNLVLDPFIGSGTTAAAAILHQRNYLGIELHSDHIKDAEENLKETKAVLKKSLQKRLTAVH